MATEVILPKVDMDMTTGTIAVWHVKDGDTVKKGQPLFDIETDKAAMEIESPADGVIKIDAPVKAVPPIGAIVAMVFAVGEDVKAFASSAASAAAVAAPSTAGAGGASSVTAASAATPAPARGKSEGVRPRRWRAVWPAGGCGACLTRRPGSRGRIVAADVTSAKLAVKPAAAQPSALASGPGQCRSARHV
ncbi:MAG: biotin/lipoyl-containing protein [Hyphomicrobiales bacterium]